MSKYRKKRVVVEAIQFPEYDDDKGVDRFYDWVTEQGFQCWFSLPTGDSIVIQSNRGEVECHPGDWIIKGVEGEFYPCPDSVFQATYEPFEDPFAEDA